MQAQQLLGPQGGRDLRQKGSEWRAVYAALSPCDSRRWTRTYVWNDERHFYWLAVPWNVRAVHETACWRCKTVLSSNKHVALSWPELLEDSRSAATPEVPQSVTLVATAVGGFGRSLAAGVSETREQRVECTDGEPGSAAELPKSMHFPIQERATLNMGLAESRTAVEWGDLLSRVQGWASTRGGGGGKGEGEASSKVRPVRIDGVRLPSPSTGGIPAEIGTVRSRWPQSTFHQRERHCANAVSF